MKSKRGPFATVKSGNVSIPIYRVENKGYTEFRVSWYDADRKRRLKAFADEGDARRYAASLNASLTSGDVRTITLAEKDRFVYLDALDALKGLDVPLNAAARDYAAAIRRLGSTTLKEAIDFFEKHNSGLVQKTVAEVVQELLAAKKNPPKNRKPASGKYLTDLESRLGRFRDSFHCNIADIRPAEIAEFLNALPNISGRTWFNYARLIRTLFNFAQAKRYYPSSIDPMEGIEIEYIDDAEIEIFTPEELKKLFAAARPELVPFLAIAAFAGVRHTEIARLEWSHVSSTHIEITARGAKTRSRRIIPIQPNLAKWLAPYRHLSGPVAPFANMSKQLLWLADDAKVPWKHNALRHSFISYRLAKTNDENLVAVEAGNSPSMIQKHYRQIKDHTGRVITPELSDAWFSVESKRLLSTSEHESLSMLRASDLFRRSLPDRAT